MTKYTIEVFPRDNPICFRCNGSKPGVRIQPPPADNQTWLCFECFREKINSGELTLSDYADDAAATAEGFSRRGLVTHSFTVNGTAAKCFGPSHSEGAWVLTGGQLDGKPTCPRCVAHMIKAMDLQLVSLSPEVEAILSQPTNTSNFEVQW